MAAKFLLELKSKHPNLAERAEALNQRDNFIMYSKHDKLDSFSSKEKMSNKKRHRAIESSDLIHSAKKSNM